MSHRRSQLILVVLVLLLTIATASAYAAPAAQRVSNSVVSLGINPASYGGSISSLTVLGNETIDTNDLGREIQASLFFNGIANQNTCTGLSPYWYNPQEGGDLCKMPSNVYSLSLGPVGSGEINVGTNPRDWSGLGVRPAGIRIEGNHKIGPLPYAPFPEAIRLFYTVFSDNQAITPLHSVPDTAGRATPIPFLPAIYFKGNVLTRLYGLSMDGNTWTEVTSSVYTDTTGGYYKPSLYRFRAMAWMRQDLGWGVALYGRWTLTQQCTTTFPMTLASQQGQCPNFAAERYPTGTPGVTGGTNNLSLLDQSLTTIPKGGKVSRMPHMAVGNLQTIRNIVNTIYTSGN